MGKRHGSLSLPAFPLIHIPSLLVFWPLPSASLILRRRSLADLLSPIFLSPCLPYCTRYISQAKQWMHGPDVQIAIIHIPFHFVHFASHRIVSYLISSFHTSSYDTSFATRQRARPVTTKQRQTKAHKRIICNRSCAQAVKGSEKRRLPWNWYPFLIR